ncbi:MAG: methyltransferase domain-containing protein [Lachnospiraceae bacterium]|nr:methyltransferase domain-containing protein [Lachnospiraceae bacterium]
MKDYFEHIRENQDVRQNLIIIKGEMKDPQKMAELRKLSEKEPAVLLSCLEQEDAKVRKNAALILGALGTEASREALIAAYESESQRFVKSAYLTALKGCDCAQYLNHFRQRRQELLKQERTEETEKHLREELGALNALIYQYETSTGHQFIGFRKPANVVLITHRNYRECTTRQISTGNIVLLRAGVKILNADLRELLTIRTFHELLFCLDIQGELLPDKAAEMLASSNLMELLKELHVGAGPFLFRIECKSRMSLEQRSIFTKKLASKLEVLTAGQLVNTTSGYEVELRLIETKEGGFYPLLKLYTLPEKRFSYRKNHVAASIRPVQAALMMELARPYLKEEARVLDPFCGVGTMLLERNYLLHADTLYGVDLYGEAIQGARENAQIAKVPIHFIHRDFFTFTHEYPFDEIVTNLPVKGKNCTGHELDFLYRKFFDQAETLLKPGGRLFLYSHDKSFVKKQLREHKSMKLLKEWQMNDREDSWFYGIQYLGKS